MARHAIIDNQNKVVNIVLWDGAEWLPPRNHTVVDVTDKDCHIGDTYEPQANTFTRTQE